jgi:hypothetical protein
MLGMTLSDYDTRPHEMQPGVTRLEPPAAPQVFTA